MQHLKKRQSDPQYLKTLTAQKEIIIQEEKRKCEEFRTQNEKVKNLYTTLEKSKREKQQQNSKEIFNLKLAVQHMQSSIEELKHEKSQAEFSLNNSKIKLQELTRENSNEMERVKNDYESQKQLLNIKIKSLEQNLEEIRKYYKIQQNIHSDKKKIIEDSNRDLKGFSNEKQQRLLIIQNQQYKNEIQYQSKAVTIQLDKNEKLQQQIRKLKGELSLHKEIESDLVKRSSMGQTLIKKLNRQLHQLKGQRLAEDEGTNRSRISQNSIPSSKSNSQREVSDKINDQRLEIAKLRNENRYLETVNLNYSKKYETLGSMMVEYLENLMYFKQKEIQPQLEGVGLDVQLNVSDLKEKDVKEWKFQELQVILNLLLNQIKPFFSKNSLINFPQKKNINISFVEEASKEPVSLPKITQNYEKHYNKQLKKVGNRFKDIPIDISTKILRSNLRDWGSKINYGNMPMTKKDKSRSMIGEQEKSMM